MCVIRGYTNASEAFKTKLYKVSFANRLLKNQKAHYVLDRCSDGSLVDPNQLLMVKLELLWIFIVNINLTKSSTI